jgi:CheY-like chemotaxis protein
MADEMVPNDCPYGQYESELESNSLHRRHNRNLNSRQKNFKKRVESPELVAFRKASEITAMTLLHSKSVFVVDDDAGMRKGLQRLLRAHGFRTEVFDSAEAVCTCANLDDAFCVVLDINLNGSSGIELRHKLASGGVALPVVYITAAQDDATREAALASGCIAYLTKPFPSKALIEPIVRASSEINL